MPYLSLDTKLPRVLLSGHLPPPVTGIGIYYQTLLSSSLPKRVNLRFIDTSLRRRPGSETGKWSPLNVVSAIGDCLRFARAVLTQRPEICHIATTYGLSFLKHSICVLIARILGSKVLLHPHCSLYFLYERKGKTWQWFVREVIGLCHGVAVLSKEWNTLQEIIPGCRLYYLPNAIDLQIYARVGQEKIESEADKSCLRVLYLGHIGQEKGSFDLVCAARTVLEEDRPVVFDIVGQEQAAGDLQRLMTEIRDAGLETFIHVRAPVVGAEKIELFRSADLFVYPSYHEGMPMAIMEAMACGLPIIATRVGGVPDLICSGLTGLLVPPGQPDQLANAIRQLAVNPQLRKSMQVRSFQWAHANFDIENLVSRLVQIYRMLLSSPQEIPV